MVYHYVGSATDFLWRNTGGLVTGVIYRNKPGSVRPATGKIMSRAAGTLLRSEKNFIRVAGISGALAVGLGAYGAHVFSKKEVPENLKQVYETANRYHLIHTLALLCLPHARRPLLTGTLLSIGMLIFCGSCYIHALTANKEIRKVTPFGGVLLMVGWISFAL